MKKIKYMWYIGTEKGYFVLDFTEDMIMEEINLCVYSQFYGIDY